MLLPPEKCKVRDFTFTRVILASLIAQLVKNLPAMQEPWVRFLGQEDPLEKETATHCSTLAWRIPWAEQPGRLQSAALQELHTTEQLKGESDFN